MIDFNDIVEAHTTTDDVDLQAILNEASEEMGTPPALSPVDQTVLAMQHMDYAVSYLGGVVLSVADTLGVLPEGLDTEYDNLQLALQLDKLRRLYAIKQNQDVEIEGQTQIDIGEE